MNNADEPIFAVDFHEVLLDGSIYRMAQFDRVDPERLVLLERQWIRGLQRFLSEKTTDRGTVYQRRAWGGRVLRRVINIPETISDD